MIAIVVADRKITRNFPTTVIRKMLIWAAAMHTSSLLAYARILSHRLVSLAVRNAVLEVWGRIKVVSALSTGWTNPSTPPFCTRPC